MARGCYFNIPCGWLVVQAKFSVMPKGIMSGINTQFAGKPWVFHHTELSLGANRKKIDLGLS